MPQSIRSILGKSGRVKKPTRPTIPSRPSSGSGSPSQSPRKPKPPTKQAPSANLFPEKLDDQGLAALLTNELTLRDVVQAMRHIRKHMFSPVPATGFNSTRTTELLNWRATLPQIVTTGHLNAILNSPTRVERELAELNGKGVVRKVRVLRRGGIGHALIESSDLEAMIGATGMSDDTKANFIAVLRKHPLTQTVPKGTLTVRELDELVRAGFLVNSMQATIGTTLGVRPEDRTTLTSIQHVSQFASGTVSAVGGPNAIHMSGGGGGGGGSSGRTSRTADDHSGFRLAIPGHGRYLKVADAAIDWLRESLAKTKWGEGPESWLKERFEGGGLYGPRWKDFWGLEWDWLLGEAVGLGIVELFDTSSVGRGVRASGA